MDIKEIKTENFEGLAVLVPDDFKDYAGANNNELFYWTETCTQSTGDYPYSVHVPNIKEYKILGKANELTEEQCETITPCVYDGREDVNVMGLIYECYDGSDFTCNTAKESFASLMQSIRCYSVNPVPNPEPQFDERGNGGYCETWVKDYEKAQANTGTWIILKKL